MKLRNDAVARCSEVWKRAELGDPRRTRRAVLTARSMARRPSAPLPAALVTDAAVQGTYRFVNNSRVDFETLMAVQGEITRQRAEEESGDVLVLHDTSDCKFAHLDPEEIGYLNTGKAGFRLHASLVVDALGWRRPIGVVCAETVHRAKPRRRKKKGKVSGPETATWKDKEFERWRRGIEVSQARLAGCANVVHVADRESDSYELMHATLAVGGRFVFRVRVDRRGRLAHSNEHWSTVTQIAQQLEGRFEREVPLSPRKASGPPTKNRVHPPRRARIARLGFAATRIEVPRPQYLHDPIPRTLVLNLVHVFEVDPPEGEPAVEWLLYTTEPIDTAAAVERVVDIYRTRWLSEEFHAALKGGCAFESREFESRHGLLNILALTLPIACEVLALRSGARSDDRRPATAVLTPDQLRILRKIGHYPLPTSPTACEALLAVAALGGHLKRNGPPGWKVMSRGMTELLTYEAAEARGAGEDLDDL
jgi:hypothetical protein